MITIRTHEGKSIEIILQSELCDPVNMGEYIRAYCHIHGSDHQRSLSINKATGWGHCFNAACNATVLVGEWNPSMVKHLLHMYYQGLSSASLPSYQPPYQASKKKREPFVFQPMLFHPPKSVPKWQQDELAMLLSLDEQMRMALTDSQRAQAYLNERAISLDMALTAGVRYLPPAVVNRLEAQKQRRILSRWAERLLFPLTSPAGKGYIGRSLWHWQPGMDENVHKSLLDLPGRPRRWIKTNPAGWFSVDLDDLSNSIIIVEGAFDRLTLLMGGFQPADVIALEGTAAPIDWFPPQVNSLVLAFDSDEGGKEATSRLADQLVYMGIRVRLCIPPQDRWGKDWNERWRRIGSQSLYPLFEALFTGNA
jgi:Toprim domain-containing protein